MEYSKGFINKVDIIIIMVNLTTVNEETKQKVSSVLFPD